MAGENNNLTFKQGCISCGTCSYLELTEDHVLTSAYVKIFRIVTRNAVNKSFWRKKDCSWPPLNKYAMNIWLSSLRIRAHLSWRTRKHFHVLHVLQTYSTCSCPGQQDTTTYAALIQPNPPAIAARMAPGNGPAPLGRRFKDRRGEVVTLTGGQVARAGNPPVYQNRGPYNLTLCLLFIAVHICIIIFCHLLVSFRLRPQWQLIY